MTTDFVKFRNPDGRDRYLVKGRSTIYGTPREGHSLNVSLCAPWDGVSNKVQPTNGVTYTMVGEVVPPPPNANPKQAFGDKKIPLSLVPRSFINGTSLGLAEGMLKYGAWNFRGTKVEAMTYASAILRHFEAYIHGEDCDPITKVPHLYSASAGLAILIDTGVQGTLIDNRPPKQDTSAQVKDIEEVLAHLKGLYKDHNPVHYTCQTP